MPVINRIGDYAADMTGWRRWMHRNPELGFECHKTAAFVAARLREFGVGFLFAHGLGKQPGVMLGMLLKILGRHPVARQLRITRKLGVFVDDLLRRAAHFSFRSRTVEDPVDDISDVSRRTVAVLL